MCGGNSKMTTVDESIKLHMKVLVEDASDYLDRFNFPDRWRDLSKLSNIKKIIKYLEKLSPSYPERNKALAAVRSIEDRL